MPFNTYIDDRGHDTNTQLDYIGLSGNIHGRTVLIQHTNQSRKHTTQW